MNSDLDMGDGERWMLNVQPVIPIGISDDWNLVSRTIVPLIDQSDVIDDRIQSGLGDITQSLFLSPKAVALGIAMLVFGIVCHVQFMLGLRRIRAVWHTNA